MNAPYKRVLLFVMDSVGAGELPDAKNFGDEGANTLAHIAQAVGGLKLPTLEKMGLGHLTKIQGVQATKNPIACFGKASELSQGKDTTTGHWEMAGIETKTAFPTFPQGFPKNFIEHFIHENKLPGVLGNKAASGTAIIDELGAEHIKSGKPIVYTSADSVFQIACHEEHFGLERLYKICENARKLCDPLNVSRVIARPFIGEPGSFQRTGNRKDYSIALPEETMMEKLLKHKLATISIGKVANIYNNAGFSKKVTAKNNREIMNASCEELKKPFQGLLFANFVDFDMLYGHRRDSHGYAKELEWFDSALAILMKNMQDGDLLMITADHGNDPTYTGTDHTREYVPILAYSKTTEKKGGKDLKILSSFADLGQTILEALGTKEKLRIGKSFLGALL